MGCSPFYTATGCPPDLTVRHRGGKLPITTSRLALVNKRPRSTVCDHITEARRRPEPASRPRSWTLQLHMAIKFEKDHMREQYARL
jgi:hypothetical protein